MSRDRVESFTGSHGGSAPVAQHVLSRRVCKAQFPTRHELVIYMLMCPLFMDSFSLPFDDSTLNQAFRRAGPPICLTSPTCGHNTLPLKQGPDVPCFQLQCTGLSRLSPQESHTGKKSNRGRMFLQKTSDLTVGRQVSFNQTLVAILFTNVDDAARKHCSRYTETSSFPIRCIATGARDIKEPSASEDQDERTIYQRCDCCVEVGANGDQADSASPISH